MAKLSNVKMVMCGGCGVGWGVGCAECVGCAWCAGCVGWLDCLCVGRCV